MPTSKEQPKDDFYEGYHVVALIDVLGQKQKLAEWAKLPPAVELTPELQKVLKSTVGTLLPFRDAFDDFFQQAAMTERRQRMLDALPAQAQQLYRRYLDCSLGIQQFSDTFVFYARLHDVHGDLSVEPFYRILTACCSAMIFGLAGRVPLRGAVAVGRGMELAEGNFYGPALAEAHCVESTKAGYPRILAAESAVAFARGNAGFSSDPTIEKLMESMARTCRSLLCHDADGQVIVDFLGKGWCDIQQELEPELVRAVRAGYDFVCAETERFREAGDKKHLLRYERLREYMGARLPIWSPPEESERGE